MKIRYILLADKDVTAFQSDPDILAAVHTFSLDLW